MTGRLGEPSVEIHAPMHCIKASVVSKILAEITSVEWERKRRNTKEEKISQQGEKSYSHKGDFGIRIKRNKILAFAGDRSLCAGDCRFYFICI